MDSAIPLLLFLAFLFGGVVLILLMGYWSRDQEREDAAVEASLANETLLELPPAFFEKLAPAERKVLAAAVDDAIIEGVERFLRQEEAVAKSFAAEPSIERLHDVSERERRFGESLVERMEEYLRGELEQVTAFLLDPSVERLYGNAPSSGDTIQGRSLGAIFAPSAALTQAV